MADFFSQSSFGAVFLTLLAYQAALMLRKKWNSPLCNPILVAVVIVAAVLTVSNVPNAVYQAGVKPLSWLLTPATVSLAVPMYEQLRVLKKDLKAILLGVFSGTAVGIGCVWGMSKMFCLEDRLLLSLLPKSITTAMGIALSEQMGGLTALTTAAIVVTGVFGSLTGETLCKILRLKSNAAKGVAFGTASHVVGTARATELDAQMGAVSSLSLVAAGILTAVILPVLASIG